MLIIGINQYERIRAGLTEFLSKTPDPEKFMYKEINGFSYEDREEHKKIAVVDMDFVHDAWMSKLRRKLIKLTILSHYCGNLVEYNVNSLDKITPSTVSHLVKSMKHSIEVMKFTNGGKVKQIH